MKNTETHPRHSQQQMVKPRLLWRILKLTNANTATQLVVNGEVMGLYWHTKSGFQRTLSAKTYGEELHAKRALLQSGIKQCTADLDALKEEVKRLNNELSDGLRGHSLK